jgi:hypothetical protein
VSKLTAEDLIPDVRLREADADAFRHYAIATQVAELAADAETPVNIALFGPWGSGKSSFFELLRKSLKDRDNGIRVIRYDAWKFGGASLKRNFLSNAATELGYHHNRVSGHEFNLGLYETRKTVHFDPKRFLNNGRWKGYVYLLLFVFALTCVALAVSAGVTSIGREDFTDQLTKLAPGMFKFFFTGLVALGAAAKFLDGARIETQQSQPSEDEEFAELFKRLVERATKDSLVPRRAKTHTLVFFIDELDRCSKRDVVLTLSSLRTFLDQPKCVFIVAADREVLEEALDEVDQATPVREDEPYYSSASEFLDKIFQHQFSLPPLRAQRLTGFARDLVVGKGGLWAELDSVEAGGRRLNSVLYALIPAHVRSPRRVKVLLNNYATNARVIQARGIDWLARATEIAKLTVLQTEFPRLAADLHLEPRLPSLLLDPPTTPTDRQRLLLSRHALASASAPAVAAAEESDNDEEEVAAPPAVEPHEPPDRLLAGHSNTALRNRQREDLQRYLVSRAAAGIPDPGRDLLYLESAGEPAGLADAELGQLIDEYAANEPGRVTGALANRTPEERVAAARVLGQMSEREFGQERVNMVTALAGALEGLAPAAIQGHVGDLVENVGSYQAEEELIPGQLPGLLVLAAAAGVGGETLARSILRNGELLAAPERVRSVSVLLPVLTDADAVAVERALARYYRTDPELLLDVIASAEPAVVDRLLRNGLGDIVALLTPGAGTAAEPPLSAVAPAGAAAAAPAVTPAETSAEEVESARGLFDTLLNALEERGAPLAFAEARVMRAFLQDPHVVYPVLRSHAQTVIGRLPADGANTFCLEGLMAGSADDWEFWSSNLTAGGGGTGQGEALASLILGLDDASPQTQGDAREVVGAIIGSGALDGAEAIVDAARAKLSERQWWDSAADTGEQVALHGLLRAIAAAEDGLAVDLDALLEEDLRRADHNAVTWDAEVVASVQRLSCASSDMALQAAETLATNAVDNGAPREQTTAARVEIAAELHRRNLPFAAIPAADVVAVTTSGEASADSVLAAWLATEPASSDVFVLLKALTRYRSAVAPALSMWAERSGSAARTELFREVLGEAGIDARWLEAIRPGVADSSELADFIADRMVTATAMPSRERLVVAARALNFEAPRSRRAIATSAVHLLSDQPNKSKSEIALQLIEILDGDYGQMKGALREAALRADAQGLIADRQRKTFERAGLVNKKPKKWGPFTIPGT